MDLKKQDILQLADLNLAESIREMARWNAMGEILEQDDLVLTNGAGRSPVTHNAIYLNNQINRPDANTFTLIRSFYRERKSGFSIYIRKHADSELESMCVRNKMLLISDAPGMMMDKPFPYEKLPDTIKIRQAADLSGVADFASVAIQSYQSLGLPPEVGSEIFASPERLLKPSNHIIVAYDKDQPVSAAMLIFSNAIAGIYWVGTVTGARGRGLAGACVRAITNEAFRTGAPLVILQASKFGEPLYRRMGFKEFTRYPWYMYFEKAPNQ